MKSVARVPDWALPPRMAHWFAPPSIMAVVYRSLVVGSAELRPVLAPQNRPFSMSAMIQGPLPEPKPQVFSVPK